MKQRITRAEYAVDNDGILSRLLVAALADSGCSKADGDKLVSIWHKEGKWDITFKIEDVDINLGKIMAEWEKQFDRMVADQAKELVLKKVGVLTEELQLMTDVIASRMKSEAEKTLGLGALENED